MTMSTRGARSPRHLSNDIRASTLRFDAIPSEGSPVDIKIGVQDTPREITIESAQSPEDVTRAVEAAINAGTLLSLTDDRGRTVLVPGGKIAYVEIGPASTRKVGFGSTM